MNARDRPAAPRLEGSRQGALYRRLVLVCRARGCSPDDALDVVQEAHARLLAYQRIALVKDAPGILRRIVINITANRHRDELATARFSSESIGRLDRLGMLIDPAAGPERALAAQQELEGLARILRLASLRACQVFLAHRGGYSYEEIGAAFVIKRRTTEKHVATAMEMLTDACSSQISQSRRPAATSQS